MSEVKDLHLSNDTFKKMRSLRFLKFHYFNNYVKLGKTHLPVNIQPFSDKLRYLHWDSYPLPSLSLIFCIEKLVELNMPNSHVKKLWNGEQVCCYMFTFYFCFDWNLRVFAHDHTHIHMHTYLRSLFYHCDRILWI